MEKEESELKLVEYSKSVSWDYDKIRDYITHNFCKRFIIQIHGNTVSLKTDYIISKYKPKRGRPTSEKTIPPGLRINEEKWRAVSEKYKGKINKMFNEWIDTL